MRLIRYGSPGHERPGVLIPGSDHVAVDISDLTADIDGVFLVSGVVPEPVPGPGTRRPHRHRNPAGVGMGQDPPRCLAPGDVIELDIRGLGTHRNPVLAAQQ
jgi:hypothetical protein